MKPHELQGALRRSGLAPLYLIVGEEAYLRDEAVATLKASILELSRPPGGEEHKSVEETPNYRGKRGLDDTVEDAMI